jgi:hypothetical protein
MKARRASSKVVCPQSHPSLSIVVAYEDYLTGNRALRTCDRLIKQFRRNTHCTSTSWKFDLLRLPKLKEMAAEEATLADMIIVSAHAASEVPSELKEWMELWLEKKNASDSALVALLHFPKGRMPETSPFQAFLRAAARRAKLDFFSQYCETVDNEFDLARDPPLG